MSALSCHGVHEAFEGVVDNLENNDLLDNFAKNMKDESISIRKQHYNRKSMRESRVGLKVKRTGEGARCCGGGKSKKKD